MVRRRGEERDINGEEREREGSCEEEQRGRKRKKWQGGLLGGSSRLLLYTKIFFVLSHLFSKYYLVKY